VQLRPRDSDTPPEREGHSAWTLFAALIAIALIFGLARARSCNEHDAPAPAAAR